MKLLFSSAVFLAFLSSASSIDDQASKHQLVKPQGIQSSSSWLYKQIAENMAAVKQDEKPEKEEKTKDEKPEKEEKTKDEKPEKEEKANDEKPEKEVSIIPDSICFFVNTCNNSTYRHQRKTRRRLKSPKRRLALTFSCLCLVKCAYNPY